MVRETTLRIGIDIGGTFTDLVAYDEEQNTLLLAKSPSTPADFSRGVIDVLDEVSEDFSQIALFIHGTTAPLNAFLERKGARTALLTTRGFGDVYVMRRGNRTRMYDLQYRNPEPLVPRSRTFEIDERLDAEGEVLKPVDEAQLREVLADLRALEAESVAVCFLNSYINPVHERAVTEFFRREAPGLFVAPSYEICREWREFERTSTAVINAYISPILKRYLDRLGSGLAERAFDKRIFLMQSNGGLISAEEAKSKALLTLMSGPIGASVGSRVLSQQIGEPNLICIDMGGTSFEVSLVVDGAEAVVSETEFEGFPILTSLVDIHSIGAGGGSIAWNDAGALRVGPQSAGAEPGPACYGKGGDQVTVTDANVMLGRIDPGSFLGGNMHLDAAKSQAVLEQLASTFGLAVDRMAEGVLDVVNAKMANAIRTMTISKGIDPRDFALIAFGGAGPMHAAFIARELGIPRIIVPEVAGAFSAWGMLTSDIRHDATQSYNQDFDTVDWKAVNASFAGIERELGELLGSEGVPAGRMAFLRYLDIRYVGQEYYVSVPLAEGAGLDGRLADTVSDQFHGLYQQNYGHSNPEEKLELANIRVEARGHITQDKEALAEAPIAGGDDTAESVSRAVCFYGEYHDTPFVHRSNFSGEEPVAGPMVILEKSCTTVVPPDYSARKDGYRNLVLEKRDGK